MVQLHITTPVQAAPTHAPKSSIIILAEKNEEEQLEQLQALYDERKVPVGKAAGTSGAILGLVSVSPEAFVTGVCANDREAVELVLNALFSLVASLPLPDAQLAVEKLGGGLLAGGPFTVGFGWHSMAGAAVRTLNNFHLYYADHLAMQAVVFRYLAPMAAKARLTDVLPKPTAELFNHKNLPVDQRRELLRLLQTALRSDNRPQAAADVAVQLLFTYPDSDATSDSAREDARAAVCHALADPQQLEVDHLLGIGPIRCLESSDPILWRLLQVFSNSGLDDYRSVVKEIGEEAVEKQLGVPSGVLEQKMKVLSLVSMAEQSHGQPLSLDRVGQELDIPDPNNLEHFLIDAIRQGAIQGKINGVKRELAVHTFIHRNFNRPQWELLRHRLQTLLTSMKQAHHQIAVTNHSDEV